LSLTALMITKVVNNNNKRR